jgi:hypothetical protein
MSELRCPNCGAVLTVTPKKPESKPQPIQQEVAPKAEVKAVTTSSIKVAFPEDLEAMLTFEDKGDSIRIKPRQFLGSENFAKIAAVVRGLSGEYVSAGKDSHFRVAK